MLDFTEKVYCAIRRYSMLSAGDTVVVGVSGGADSVALLHFLVNASEAMGINVVAAHLNHGIRGEEAERDECYVKQLCDSLNIRLCIRHADCPAQAELSGQGLEETGRRLRYEFFAELAKNEKNGRIATAHNADDNAETVIFNLARGASLAGVAGIPPVRDNIIRPLILCTRAQIEEYCSCNSLEFVTDSTNLSDDYSRNLIRHKVLPVLCEVNSGAVEAMSRLSGLVREDAALLDSLADRLWLDSRVSDALEFDADKLSEAPLALRSRVYRRAYCELCEDAYMSSAKVSCVEQILNGAPPVQLHKKCVCKLYRGRLCFVNPDDFVSAIHEEIIVDVNGFCENLGANLLSGTVLSKKNDNVNDLFIENMLDCDTISGVLRLRVRRSGDKITLRKRNVTKTLKKLFCESGIPVEQREQIPVLADDNGPVWVMGFGVDKNHAVDDNTSKILYIEAKG